MPIQCSRYDDDARFARGWRRCLLQFTGKNRLPLVATLALLAGVGCAVQPTDTADANVPNIVIVLADDQTGSDSGAYGNPDVATPNIDRLAAEGMRFDRAYTGTAMCAPSRQQLYTGLYPLRSGAYPQNSSVHDGTLSIAHYLTALGYRVGISGKRHYAPAASFPFEVLNADGEDVPDVRRIAEFVRRDRAQPFMLVVASKQPHTPWNQGARRYDPAALTVPADLVDTPETRQALADYYREVTDFDTQLGDVLALVDEAGISAETLFIYTSEQGAMLPRAKWTLYDRGIRTAFIARWPGRIAAASLSNALVHYVDVVPTLIEVAGGDAVDVDGRSFLDVLTGDSREHNEYVFGVHTTNGICNGNEYPIRAVRDKRFKLIVNGNAGTEFRNNISARDPANYFESWRQQGEAGDRDALRKHRDYRWRPAIELYDLDADPLELHNLADDPDYSAVRARLQETLRQWQYDQGENDMRESERNARQRIAADKAAKLSSEKCNAA